MEYSQSLSQMAPIWANRSLCLHKNRSHLYSNSSPHKQKVLQPCSVLISIHIQHGLYIIWHQCYTLILDCSLLYYFQSPAASPLFTISPAWTDLSTSGFWATQRSCSGCSVGGASGCYSTQGSCSTNSCLESQGSWGKTVARKICSPQTVNSRCCWRTC